MNILLHRHRNELRGEYQRRQIQINLGRGSSLIGLESGARESDPFRRCHHRLRRRELREDRWGEHTYRLFGWRPPSTPKAEVPILLSTLWLI